MKISQNTKNIVAELTEYSGRKIKNADEIAILIELADKSDKGKLFYDIQFTAKYLNGLGKILQSNVSLTTQKKPGENGNPAPSAEEAREKVMGEYKSNIIKLSAYLKDILLDADKNTQNKIEEKFLTLSRTAMMNLTTLIYDLSWLKRYFNSKR